MRTIAENANGFVCLRTMDNPIKLVDAAGELSRSVEADGYFDAIVPASGRTKS